MGAIFNKGKFRSLSSVIRVSKSEESRDREVKTIEMRRKPRCEDSREAKTVET
jgi:hypothetical protein